MSLFYIQGYTIFLVFFMQEIGTIRHEKHIREKESHVELYHY